jgi:hypothetical protein
MSDKIPLIHLDEDKNKLSIYVSEENINTESNWRNTVSHHMLDFLKSNSTGICQVKIKIDDYKPFLVDLLDYFDFAFPKRIYIRY